MNPGFSLLSPPAPRPRRRCRRWDAACILACLLATAHPVPAVAAPRAVSGAARSPSQVIGLPSAPRLGLSTSGHLSNADVAALDSLARLDRLNTSATQNYDIVPPAHPVIPAGTLPGYQIVRLGRGHNNRLCLAATIAGTKGLLMLDTGLNNTVLSNATYQSLLLNSSYTLPAGLPRTVNLNGLRAPLAEAPNFYVGKSDLGAVPVSLVPRRYLSDAGRLYDGLLGENILRHYNALIDCARLMLYLDIDPARKLNQSRSFVRHGWTRVPMSDTGSHFTVPCVLNGHEFRLVVDTGAPFTNLDRNLLAAAQIGSHDLPVRSGLIGMETQQAGLVDLDRLQIGDYLATNVHMTTTAQSLAAFGGPHDHSTGGPIVGLLGGDILASNGAVIDIGNRLLYLKQPHATPPRHE